MGIQRTCDFPAFYGYLTESALIPHTGTPSADLVALTSHNCKWLDIPAFQRGIAWKVTDVIDELLESDSPIMGNVLLGQFQRSDKPLGYLDEKVQQYCVIIDGLQRFSIGTALLSVLYPLALHHSPQYSADASYFAILKLKCANMAPVFQHNDKELLNHPRQAIANAYAELRDGLDKQIKGYFEDGEAEAFAEKITDVFLNKQIAIDVYHNFTSHLDMMSAFLGINTIRVDLGPIDLLRSYIVEKATQSGWEQSTIEQIENRITDVFTQNNQPKSELLPFVFICLEQVDDDSKATRLFPSWSSALLEDDVLTYINFIEDFMNVEDNGYVREIRELGALPLAGLLIHYYKLFLETGIEPSFFKNMYKEDEELYFYYRGCFRVYLEGKIGKTRTIIERLLDEYDLKQCAEKLSESYTSMSLEKAYDEGRLKNLIQRADIKKSKRIFNAMLLPTSDQPPGALFEPKIYGMKSIEYHIDHLIPRSTLENDRPGYLEGDTILNFAPLPASFNKEAKATAASEKLSSNTFYKSYIYNNPSPHPYCKWLVEHQANFGSDLDDQELLQHTQGGDLTAERLKEITNELIIRL